ncbi:hypothetical protein GGR57DRAFT_414562 [Xylariaceae sp. FL1272]|nr:hypothetical protein GGR57DRAFT_414562 [Xylariaceae sp. FL1272]
MSQFSRSPILRGGLAPSRTSLQFAKRYASQQTPRPPLSHGGNNRPIIIGLVAAVPFLAYYIMSPSSTRATTETTAIRGDPDSDPAARKRERAAVEEDGPKYLHPETKNPEDFKPAFGQLHKVKRVDSPPDERNHQALQDKQRQRD